MNSLYQMMMVTTGRGGRFRNLGTALRALLAGEELIPVTSAGATADADPLTPGWYLARYSHELKAEQACAITVGGLDLMMYRTPSGQVVTQDRYCPHLGGDLSMGQVVGDSLRCPYHHWRFGTEGQCVEVPRCDKIPPLASVRVVPTRERLGGIWIYVGGTVPYFEMPTNEEMFARDLQPTGRREHRYVCGSLDDFGTIRTGSLDVLENSVDSAHAPILHQSEATEFSIRTMEGPIAEFEGEFRNRSAVGRLRVGLFGPGLWASWMYLREPWWARGHYFWGLAPTPVRGRLTRLRLVNYVAGNPISPYTWFLAKGAALGTRRGVHEDLGVLDHKVRRERPVLSGSDGPIGRMRRWYAGLNQLARAADGQLSQGE